MFSALTGAKGFARALTLGFAFSVVAWLAIGERLKASDEMKAGTARELIRFSELAGTGPTVAFLAAVAVLLGSFAGRLVDGLTLKILIKVPAHRASLSRVSWIGRIRENQQEQTASEERRTISALAKHNDLVEVTLQRSSVIVASVVVFAADFFHGTGVGVVGALATAIGVIAMLDSVAIWWPHRPERPSEDGT